MRRYLMSDFTDQYFSAYTIKKIKGTGAIYLTSSNGIVMERNDMEKLIMGLQETLLHYDELEFENLNRVTLETQEEENRIYQASIKQKVRSKIKGFIYVVTYDDVNYKIGMARNLDKRFMQLSVKMPFELRLIHKMNSNDAMLTESLFHGMFEDKRVNGEWFKLSLEDVKYIENGEYEKSIQDSINGTTPVKEVI